MTTAPFEADIICAKRHRGTTEVVSFRSILELTGACDVASVAKLSRFGCNAACRADPRGYGW